MILRITQCNPIMDFTFYDMKQGKCFIYFNFDWTKAPVTKRTLIQSKLFISQTDENK